MDVHSVKVVMKKSALRLSVAVVLVLNLSCVHTRSHENAPVELSTQTTPQKVVVYDDLKIESLLVTEDKWPAEDFFKNLQRGEMKVAFQRFDLRYKPANTDSKILRELVKDGFVPVVVRITNNGDHEKQISEKNFYLADGEQKYPALIFELIPREFERFNSAAVLANVYNVSLVTIGILGVVALMSLGTHGGGPLPSPIPGNSKSGSEDSEILNSVWKKTHIEYRDLVLTDEKIAPKQTLERIVFFKVRAASNSQNLYLKM